MQSNLSVLMNVKNKIFTIQILVLSLIFLLQISFTESVYAYYSKGVVLAINGGGEATSNHPRYYRNLKYVHDFFVKSHKWRQYNLAANGPSDKNDNCTKRALFGIMAKYLPKRDSNGEIMTERVKPIGSYDGPATKKSIKKMAKKIIETHYKGNKKLFDKRGVCKVPLLLYVTDHGGMGKKNQRDSRTICLWKESMSVSDFRQIIKYLRKNIPKECPIITMNDQCFGGGMHYALRDENGKPFPNTCGFSASSADGPSYMGGGLAENLEKNKIYLQFGALFHKFQERRAGQRMSMVNPLLSVPTSTSGIFLQEYYDKKFIDRKDPCLDQMLKPPGSDFKGMSSPIIKKIVSNKLQLLKKNLNLVLKRNRAYLKPMMKKIGKGKIAWDMQTAKKLYDHYLSKEKEAYAKESKLSLELNKHLVDWMKKTPKHAKLMKEFNALNKNISETRKKRKTLSRQKQLKEMIDSSIKKANQIGKIKEAAMSGRKNDFNNYLKKIGQYNIFKKKKDVGLNMASILCTFAKRWYFAIKELNGLKKMIRNNDSQALNSYLSIIKCENTYI